MVVLRGFDWLTTTHGEFGNTGRRGVELKAVKATLHCDVRAGEQEQARRVELRIGCDHGRYRVAVYARIGLTKVKC